MVKKTIFSAIALIGFTVASYGANAVEVEELAHHNCESYAHEAGVANGTGYGLAFIGSYLSEYFSALDLCNEIGYSTTLIVPVKVN